MMAYVLIIIWTNSTYKSAFFLFFFTSDLSCKLHTTLVYVFLDFSAWLLAALSLERLFSVCRPHTVKHRCTRVTSACVISGIGIASLAINAHFLFRMGDLTVTFGDQARWVCVCVCVCVCERVCVCVCVCVRHAFA